MADHLMQPDNLADGIQHHQRHTLTEVSAGVAARDQLLGADCWNSKTGSTLLFHRKGISDTWQSLGWIATDDSQDELEIDLL
jgi:hypothetical protein